MNASTRTTQGNSDYRLLIHRWPRQHPVFVAPELSEKQKNEAENNTLGSLERKRRPVINGGFTPEGGFPHCKEGRTQ
jgi:hypothetical protein